MTGRRFAGDGPRPKQSASGSAAAEPRSASLSSKPYGTRRTWRMRVGGEEATAVGIVILLIVRGAGGDAVKLAANRAHGHLVALGVGDPGGVTRDGLHGANARTPLALERFHVRRRGRGLLHRDVGGGLVAFEKRVPVGGRTRWGLMRDRARGREGSARRPGRDENRAGNERVGDRGRFDPIRRAQVGRTRDFLRTSWPNSML